VLYLSIFVKLVKATNETVAEDESTCFPNQPHNLIGIIVSLLVFSVTALQDFNFSAGSYARFIYFRFYIQNLYILD